jgi:hypothetical protein
MTTNMAVATRRVKLTDGLQELPTDNHSTKPYLPMTAFTFMGVTDKYHDLNPHIKIM